MEFHIVFHVNISQQPGRIECFYVYAGLRRPRSMAL